LAVLERGDTITGAAVVAGLGQGGRAVAPAIVMEGEGLAAAAALHIAQYFADFGANLPPDGVYDRLLAEVERPLISACLDATGGNQLKAAKLLGINRNTLRKKLTDLGLDRAAVRRA
jgi:two-component system nitrogen regulation response regulator GlnG